MKVKELIDFLKECNQDADVYCAIRQYNKRYPVAYEEAFSFQSMGDIGPVRIITSLPYGMYTIQSKEAK